MAIKRSTSVGSHSASRARATSATAPASKKRKATRTKRSAAAKARPSDRLAAPKPEAPREHPGTPLPSLSLGETAEHRTADMPENQPTARFAGKTPALERPADPLPSFLGGPLKKHSRILGPDPSVPWRAKSVMNPTAITKDGKIYLLVRAQDTSGAGKWYGTSRIGLAESSDGINFKVRDEPVLGPTEPYEAFGGTEDPRITEVDGKYYLTYTAYSFTDKMARLSLAVSDDLVHWDKKGPLFPEFHNPPNADGWTKSGAILPNKVNGEYLMYFGDSNIFLARSKDLIHWKADDEPVLKPRPTYFDGNLVESGPAPWLDTDGNIHLLYNGDAPPPVDSGKPGGYASGEVVFSGKDPRQVLSRSNTPLLAVTEPDEMTGQVGNVLFLEGKAELNGKVFLYYGMADSYIGVAEAPAPR